MNSAVVPSLLALSAIGSPTLLAVDIGDDNVKLAVGVQLQARGEVSQAKDAAGDDYDIQGGTSFSKPDTADFYMRRARFSFKALYHEDTGLNFTVRADGADRDGTGARAELVQQAYIYHLWKMDSITHQLQIGIDYAFHDWGVNVVPSTQFLLPNITPWDAAMLNARGAGIGYRFNSPMVTFGADVQNNKRDTDSSGTAADPSRAEGLWYSGRVEITGPGDLAMKDTESCVGRKGTGFRIGLEAADDSNDRNAPTGTTSTSIIDYGIDGTVHWDGLTAHAGASWDTTRTKPDAGAAPPDVKAFGWGIQAGYAIPLSTFVLEPAARYSRVDLNKDLTETTPYNSTIENGDAGGSGRQIDIGLNFYWQGHNSKTQLEYTSWKAEGGDAKASIFRIQEQLAF